MALEGRCACKLINTPEPPVDMFDILTSTSISPHDETGCYGVGRFLAYNGGNYCGTCITYKHHVREENNAQLGPWLL